MLLVKLRIKKREGTVEELATLNVPIDASKTTMIAAANKFLAPRNEGSSAWDPHEVLLAVTPVG